MQQPFTQCAISGNTGTERRESASNLRVDSVILTVLGYDSNARTNETYGQACTRSTMIVNKLTPQNGMPGFHACQTNKFKLNYFETASGLRFVLNTDLQAGDMRECLRHIYGGLYVEYASKNALYKLGEPLDNELFVQSVDQYIRSLPSFAS